MNIGIQWCDEVTTTSSNNADQLYIINQKQQKTEQYFSTNYKNVRDKIFCMSFDSTSILNMYNYVTSITKIVKILTEKSFLARIYLEFS